MSDTLRFLTFDGASSVADTGITAVSGVCRRCESIFIKNVHNQIFCSKDCCRGTENLCKRCGKTTRNKAFCSKECSISVTFQSDVARERAKLHAIENSSNAEVQSKISKTLLHKYSIGEIQTHNKGKFTPVESVEKMKATKRTNYLTGVSVGSWKGKTFSESHRKALSESHIGKQTTNGLKFSEEAIKKLL